MQRIIIGSFMAILVVLLSSCNLENRNERSLKKNVDSELEKQSREIGFYAEIGKKINPLMTEEIDISQKGVEMLQERFSSEMTKGDDASCYFYRKTGIEKSNKITFYKNNAIKICETTIDEGLAKDKFHITKFARYGGKFFVELYSDKKDQSMLATIDIKTGKWGKKIRTIDGYDRVIVYKNCFYCFFGADVTIYSLDGSVDNIKLQREDETKNVDVQFIIDNRIYFFEWYYSQRTVKIRRSNLDGKDAETLFQYRCNEGTEGWFDYGALKVDEKYLYILAPYGSATLTRIPLYGGEIQEIASTNWFDLSEENIFYLGDKNYIYKVNKNLKEDPIVVTELHSKEALIPFLYADNHLMVEGYDKKEWKIINEIWEWGNDKMGFDITNEYVNKYYWVSEMGEVDEEIKGSGLKKEYYDLYEKK